MNGEERGRSIRTPKQTKESFHTIFRFWWNGWRWERERDAVAKAVPCIHIVASILLHYISKSSRFFIAAKIKSECLLREKLVHIKSIECVNMTPVYVCMSPNAFPCSLFLNWDSTFFSLHFILNRTHFWCIPYLFHVSQRIHESQNCLDYFAEGNLLGSQKKITDLFLRLNKVEEDKNKRNSTLTHTDLKLSSAA